MKQDASSPNTSLPNWLSVCRYLSWPWELLLDEAGLSTRRDPLCLLKMQASSFGISCLNVQLQELRQGVLSFLLNLAVLNGTTIQPTLLTVISALQMPFVMARDLGDEDDSGNEWTPSELVKAVHEDIAIAVDQVSSLRRVDLSH